MDLETTKGNLKIESRKFITFLMDKHTERILKAINKLPSFVINEGEIVYMRLSRDYKFEKNPKPRKFLKILVQLPDSEPYKTEHQE